MARFTDFIFGSNIATWQEAIGEVLAQLEDQRQMALAAIHLSTAALFELNNRYAALTGTVLEPAWQVETFREHLQEIIQASLMLSASREGVSQVVAATTMVPPVIKSINLLRRWLLGFQYLPNRHFFGRDGSVFATIDGPYLIDATNDKLAIAVTGGAPQMITFEHGVFTHDDIIAAINGQLIGAHAEPFGSRFFIEVNSVDSNASVKIDKTSTATDLFGLDTFTHQNAPAPSGSVGSLPTGWRLTAPGGSLSNPLNLDAAHFDTAAPQVKGSKDSPYRGLVTGSLLENSGFETGFEGWDKSEGPDFFISTTKSRSGNDALGIITTGRTDKLTSEQLLVVSGRPITVTGYHQAKAEFSESTAPVAGGPAAGYIWIVSNAIRHQPNDGTADPFSDSPFAPENTVKLIDATANFIAAGVKVGMAVQVMDPITGLEFRGIVRGVGIPVLIIDLWRTPDATPTGRTVNATLLSSTTTSVGVFNPPDTAVATTEEVITFTTPLTATQRAMIQGSPLIIKGGVTIDHTHADKLQVTTPGAFPVRYVRDIVGTTADGKLIVKDWGGLPKPPVNSAAAVWIRPHDGSPYKVWDSLAAIGTSTTTAVSAQFKYTLTFYDAAGAVIGTATTGPIIPAPSDDYTQFTLNATVPVGARYATLTIEVNSDPAGTGARATIDDITAILDIPGASLHLAADDQRMQKIQFTDVGANASGTIVYTSAPSDGDRVTIGSTIYEFDAGALASGIISYSGNPADGDQVTIGGYSYRFANDITTITGGQVGIQIAGTADDTFANLSSAINSIDSTVSAVQNAGADTVKITARVSGPLGDTITFTKSSTVITLTPAGGKLSGGSASSVPGGVVPVFTYLPGQSGDVDLPYALLVQAINQGNAQASARLDAASRTVTVTARVAGPDGNTVVFTGSSALPSYVFNPNTGFLSVFTGRRAGGTITFIGQPQPGEGLVIDAVAFTFDNGLGSGICPGSVQVPIGSGVSNTLANLVTAINANSAAVASADFTNLRAIVTSNKAGAAGNSDPFRSDSTKLILNPDQGDKSAQTATGTNSASRTFGACMATYVADNTPPSIASVGTGSNIAAVNSITVPITTVVPSNARVIVAVVSTTLDQDPTPPTVTDTLSGIYVLDAARTGPGSGRAYLFSRIVPDGLGLTKSIIVSTPSGNMNGVAVSVFSTVTLCRADQIASSGGASASLSVGPTPALHESGELVLALFGVLGPNTDTFTAGPNYIGIGRVGTGAGANQVTADPEYRVNSTSRLAGGADSLFANPDALTCAEVASFINARVSGITASCEVVSGVFDHGRIVLSGKGACVIVGHGDANTILGLPDDEGVCNDPSGRIPGWEVVAGQSGVVAYITHATPAARKAFGTTWHARFWATAFHPSGIALTTLSPPSGVTAVATVSFDGAAQIVGDRVQLDSKPRVVEVVTPDFGKRIDSIEVTLTVSGLRSGIHSVMSDPFLINETTKSLHLASHTIPRNKQREHRLHRMFIANPDPFTVVEFGLLGLTAQRISESIQVNGNQSFQLRSKDLIDGSETVQRSGNGSAGTIVYSGNPTDGNKVVIGDETYEFDTDFVIGPNSIQVVITPDTDATMTNLVDQINSNSLVATATIDTIAKQINITAQQPGVAGDELDFATAASGIFTESPITGKLAGGADPVLYLRDIDYEMDFELGRIKRKPGGSIPDPSPADLVIAYSYSSAGIDPQDSYPQNIKQVGAKIEADITADLIFYGTMGDFTNASGIAVNLSAVERVPTRFSYLKPVVRGVYQQVVTFSGVGFTAGLDYAAKTDQPALLLKDGQAVPTVSGVAAGWHFVNDKTIAISSGEFSAVAVYEFEYTVKFQYTTAPIAVADIVSPYVLVPYSYKMRNAEETLEDVERVLQLDENRIAELALPAVQDKSIAELTKTAGGVDESIATRFWRFVDETHVEVLLGTFTPDAIFTLRYKASRIDFVSPVIEQWEYATASGVNLLTNFIPFTPGDTVAFAEFVKFRVTTFGDFDIDDYRLRSFAAIIDTIDLTTCGYGIGGYGLTPYGCGFDVEEPPPPPDPTTSAVNAGGSLYLSGDHTFTVKQIFTGMWLLHPPGGVGIGVNTTTQRFIGIRSRLVIGQDSAPKVSFRLPRAVTLKTVSFILDNPLAGGASMSFRFNVNGVTVGPTSTLVAGDQTVLFDVGLDVAQDALLCLEATSATLPQPVTAIGIGYEISPES